MCTYTNTNARTKTPPPTSADHPQTPTTLQQQLDHLQHLLQNLRDLPEARFDEGDLIVDEALSHLATISLSTSDVPPLNTPERCHPDIFKKGTVVSVLSGGQYAVQGLVDEANRSLDNPVDWYYAGGMVVIKTLGDVAKAAAALREAFPKLV